MVSQRVTIKLITMNQLVNQGVTRPQHPEALGTCAEAQGTMRWWRRDVAARDAVLMTVDSSIHTVEWS